MGKVNTWYVIGKKDESSIFGYSQVGSKNLWYKTYNEAKQDRTVFRKCGVYTEGKLVIMKRTCEVIS